MAERNDKHNMIRQAVEHAVAQALQAQMPQLQSQIVQQVLEALPAAVSEGSAAHPARWF